MNILCTTAYDISVLADSVSGWCRVIFEPACRDQGIEHRACPVFVAFWLNTRTYSFKHISLRFILKLSQETTC